jgi:uncharacterized protein YcbK (DUF882 family)
MSPNMKSRTLALCVAGLVSATTLHLALGRIARSMTVPSAATSAPALLAASLLVDPAAMSAAAAPSSPDMIIEPLPPPPVIVSLRNINNDETATLPIGRDGEVDAATGAALEHFLRCRRTNREKPIAPGVLAMLVAVAQHWPGRVIDIVSGFRAPPFGAPHSKHFQGHAIDLRVEGVKTTTLRDFVWRENHQVGVGHYLDENFVHMDWRPGETDTAWSLANDSDPADYHPRWAWSARHPSLHRGRRRL